VEGGRNDPIYVVQQTPTSLTSNDTTAATSTRGIPEARSPHGTDPPHGTDHNDDDASLLSLETISPSGSVQGLPLMLDDLVLPFLGDMDCGNDADSAAAAATAVHPYPVDVSADFDLLQSPPPLPSKLTVLADKVGNALTSTSSSQSLSPAPEKNHQVRFQQSIKSDSSSSIC